MIYKKCPERCVIYELFLFFFSQNSSQSLTHLASTREGFFLFFNASSNDWVTYLNCNFVAKCSFFKLFKCQSVSLRTHGAILLFFFFLKTFRSHTWSWAGETCDTYFLVYSKGPYLFKYSNIGFQRGKKINIWLSWCLSKDENKSQWLMRP